MQVRDVKNAKSSGVSLFKTPLKRQNPGVSAILSAFQGVSDTETPFQAPSATTTAPQVTTRSAFALRYNDKSPLEAHHVAAAFSLMLREGHDVLGRLEPLSPRSP